MELEGIFKELNSQINPELLYDVDREDDAIKVEIIEKVRSGDKNPPTLTNLTLFGFDNVIPLDQDLIVSYQPLLLHSKKGMNKTCDGVLIASIGGHPCFVVMEMKSSLSNLSQHVDKMRAGKNLVDYLKIIILEYLDIDISKWDTYYCVFHTADPKRETIHSTLDMKDPHKPIYFCVENNDRFSALKLINRSLLTIG